MNKTLHLIDAMNLINRYFYAMGQPVTGFMNHINRLRSDSSVIAVAFDNEHPTFRHQVYPEYKATRPDKEDKARTVISEAADEARTILEGEGIPCYSVIGYEADDIIGTLTNQWDGPVEIHSNDKDLWQLVTDQVVCVTGSHGIVGPAEVYKKLGVNPDQVIHYKAMVGDKSDNIPGVHLIGPKTAVILLDKWVTYGNIIQNTHWIKGAARKRLEEGEDKGWLSLKLATIRCDLDIKLEEE